VKCVATNRLGMPCRAFAITGSEKCYLHSSKAKARRAGRAGGLKQSLAKRLKSFPAPKSVTDLTTILAATITEVRAGRCATTNPANAIGQLAAVLVKCLETSSLEKRVAAIEAHDSQIRSQMEALRRR
jgi:hypothetical protein